jgi:nitrite reductase/ring-hydroxylating ferredoxin subunit
VTVFRHRGKLSVIDSICHHAGGPMTDGKISDIEELGLTVVACPWHKFLVSIDGGIKVFKSVEIRNGVPTEAGWVG